MVKYTQEQIDNIPNILKSHWTKEWIKEQNKPENYLGRLAILVEGKPKSKALIESHWITEGIDFEIAN